jgi:hypothetical protein
VVEQPWQVTQYGGNTAGETIYGADILKIGGKLGWILVRKIEKLVAGYTAS